MRTAGWIMFGILLFAAVYASFMYGIFFNVFHRKKEVSLDEIDLSKTYYAPYAGQLREAMRRLKQYGFEKRTIISCDGLELVGLYHDAGSSHTAVFVHGYRATPFNNYALIAQDVAKLGYNLFFPIQRAHGESGGSWITFGEREQDDLLRWMDDLLTRDDPDSVIVYGLSMGASTVALAADRFPDRVKAIVLDCGYANLFERIRGQFRRKTCLPPGFSTRCINLICKRKLGFDMRKTDTAASLGSLKVPVLFFHGKNDTTVRLEEGMKNYDRCSAPKTRYYVENAPHAISYMAGGEKTKEILSGFLKENDPHE